MKKLATLSTVIALHVAVISMMFIQPGCGSTPEQEKTSAKTQTGDAVDVNAVNAAPQTANAPEVEAAAPDAQEAQTQVAPLPEGSIGLRAAPSRPEGGTWNMNGGGKVIVEAPAIADKNAPEANAVETVARKTPSLTLSTYKVQKGDSLWSIAKKHNVTFGEILKANGFSKDSKIKVGQEIQIPNIAKTDVSNKATDKSAAGAEVPKAATAEDAKAAADAQMYVVKSGDSLSKIAYKHRVSISKIKALNSLKNDTIRIGQKLKLPAASSTVGAKAAPANISGPAKASGDEISHLVVSGETLGAIAKKYGTSVSKITALNSIKDPRKIRVGQKILIPAAKGAKKTDAKKAEGEVKTNAAPIPVKADGISASSAATTLPATPAAPAATISPDVETVEIVKPEQAAQTPAGGQVQAPKAEGAEVIDL